MVPSSPLPAPRPAFARWMGTTNQITRTFLAAGAIPDLINVAGGLPDPDIYPTDGLAEIARRAVAEHPDEVLGYGPVEGLPRLRHALARRLSSPALPLTHDNVLVTTSGMQALDLVGKVLLEEGGLIAGQYPTYLGALDAWRPRAPRSRARNSPTRCRTSRTPPDASSAWRRAGPSSRRRTTPAPGSSRTIPTAPCSMTGRRCRA
ncbi:aminotransferase class I/II-fold pyridoxal phosphate-dependent enzyme [Methylobacterium currus]|uniref:aminotransferase class I/II-fold pyridoxal phosphate-dependent enzyme n=1 Tax=Methylobacterium currus TaxID=2051553 RepID=UPI0023EA62AD|nr:aminotransferase class I/II-fold pyridoxal phosphate-dependent enzyme [Methylobacterium currus]